MRAFLAVELPSESPVDALARATEHLTLLFLGEIDPGVAQALPAALDGAVLQVPQFEFVVEGVGAFPSRDRPRVVWRGVTSGRDELAALAKAVRGAVAEAGVRVDSTPFVPHVTLFRVRSSRDLARATVLLGGSESPPPPLRVPVSAVVLKSSVLGPAGATHQTLARIPLGVPLGESERGSSPSGQR